MLVYRFRLISEEIDNFSRDYDVLPGQTFLDFHSVIMESMDLTQCERASFFMTDKKYKKDKEISLKTEKRQVRKYDDDLDEVINQTITPPLMRKAKLKEFIEDPHQKMIYEFHGKDFHTFYLELFKIIQADHTFSYPRCVKRTGELPKPPEIPVQPQAEIPAPPKVSVPKVKIPPKPEEFSKPIKTEEEPAHELADIEQELEEIIGEEAPVLAVEEVSHDDDEGFSHDDEDEVEHIDDYDDIDKLESKYSGYDRESDDY